MCANHKTLNYTVLVENESKHIVTAVGPISKVGGGIVREAIESNLIANQNYSLKVQVVYHSQVVMSDKQYFRKFSIKQIRFVIKINVITLDSFTSG